MVDMDLSSFVDTETGSGVVARKERNGSGLHTGQANERRVLGQLCTNRKVVSISVSFDIQRLLLRDAMRSVASQSHLHTARQSGKWGRENQL